jgi:hypothetical protein
MPDEAKRPAPGEKGPPMAEPAAGGQYYFPGREKGCLGALLLAIAIAAVACGLTR